MAADPYLSGRFAPVGRESDADELLVEGSLPGDIDGVFMRNGPNPKFPPLGSYTVPWKATGWSMRRGSAAGRRDTGTGSFKRMG